MRKVFMNVVLKFTEKIDFASFMKDIRWFIAILRAREQYWLILYNIAALMRD